MSVEKKTIRSDIPNHTAFLGGSTAYVATPAEETRRLVVGREIALSGQVSACRHLVVEGSVQADAFEARRMDILEPGLFTGAAEVQDAVIAGRFEGRLTVLGRLTVKSTGRVYGEVSYGTLETEGGARLEGHVVPLPRPEEAKAPVPDNVESLFDNDARGDGKDGDDGEEDGDGAAARSSSPRVFRRVVGF